MLKVRQNNENQCATFRGKPVESVESVENAHSANKEWISRTPHALRTARRQSALQNKEAKPVYKRRLQIYYKTAESLKKILTKTIIELKRKRGKHHKE